MIPVNIDDLRKIGPVGVLGNNKYKDQIIGIITKFNSGLDRTVNDSKIPESFFIRRKTHAIDHAAETILLMGAITGEIIREIFLAGLFHDISLHHGFSRKDHHVESARLFKDVYSDWMSIRFDDKDTCLQEDERDSLWHLNNICTAIEHHRESPRSIVLNPTIETGILTHKMRDWRNIPILLSIADKMLLVWPDSQILRCLEEYGHEHSIPHLDKINTRIMGDRDVVTCFKYVFGVNDEQGDVDVHDLWKYFNENHDMYIDLHLHLDVWRDVILTKQYDPSECDGKWKQSRYGTLYHDGGFDIRRMGINADEMMNGVSVREI